MGQADSGAESRIPTEQDRLEPIPAFAGASGGGPRQLSKWSDGASSLEEAESGAPESLAPYHLEKTLADFLSWDSAEQVAGRELVDVDVRWDGSQARFTGVWHDTGGTIHQLIHGTSSQWTTFLTDMQARNGRWLDIEVGYFGSDKRWSGVFFEDGDFYSWAIHTTNSEADRRCLFRR